MIIHGFETLAISNYNCMHIPLEQIQDFMNQLYNEAIAEEFMHAYAGKDLSSTFEQQHFISWRNERQKRTTAFLNKQKRKVAGWFAIDIFITNIDLFHLSLINKDLPLKDILQRVAQDDTLPEWKKSFPEQDDTKNIARIFLWIHWLEQTRVRDIDADWLEKKQLYEHELPERIARIEEKRKRSKW